MRGSLAYSLEKRKKKKKEINLCTRWFQMFNRNSSSTVLVKFFKLIRSEVLASGCREYWSWGQLSSPWKKKRRKTLLSLCRFRCFKPSIWDVDRVDEWSVQWWAAFGGRVHTDRPTLPSRMACLVPNHSRKMKISTWPAVGVGPTCHIQPDPPWHRLSFGRLFC